MRILVVEDEPAIAKLLTGLLRDAKHEAIAVGDGLTALDVVEREPLDLIVLDLMLPYLDGFDVCRRIRAGSTVPILVLSARGQAADKVQALQFGADDYVSKPFDVGELLARIEAIARRTARPPTPSPDELTGGDFQVDVLARAVRVSGGPPALLTPTELKLLCCLMRQPGRVLSRERLREQVWEDGEDDGSNEVDVYVRRLRQKLEPVPTRPRYILTVRGLGYKLVGASMSERGQAHERDAAACP